MTLIAEENVKPEHAERYSGEIKDLLLVAQNQFFDDDAEVVREKEDFEKLDSFFELVQKDNLSTSTFLIFSIFYRPHFLTHTIFCHHGSCKLCSLINI